VGGKAVVNAAGLDLPGDVAAFFGCAHGVRMIQSASGAFL
jgi:hypothetical protein